MSARCPSWWSRWWYRIVRQRWRTWNCRGNYFLRESVEAFRIQCMSLWRRSVFCFQVDVHVIFDVHLEMIPLIQSSFCTHFFRSEFVCNISSICVLIMCTNKWKCHLQNIILVYYLKIMINAYFHFIRQKMLTCKIVSLHRQWLSLFVHNLNVWCIVMCTGEADSRNGCQTRQTQSWRLDLKWILQPRARKLHYRPRLCHKEMLIQQLTVVVAACAPLPLLLLVLAYVSPGSQSWARHQIEDVIPTKFRASTSISPTDATPAHTSSIDSIE